MVPKCNEYRIAMNTYVQQAMNNNTLLILFIWFSGGPYVESRGTGGIQTLVNANVITVVCNISVKLALGCY